MTLTSFQGHSFRSSVSFEPVDGISSNLHQYITATSLRDFHDIDLIFRAIALYVEYLLNQ